MRVTTQQMAGHSMSVYQTCLHDVFLVQSL